LKTASRRLINDYQGFTRSLAEPSLSVDLPVKFIDPIAATRGIGEWRNRAYRVTNELLTIWCGLDVKDGFIQRSVSPPSFLKPGKFCEWFLKAKV
jgi:hypothetical protein